MGDDGLAASSRWNSWTREAKLWYHLQSHLKTSHWPLKCPHPLCHLQLDNETLFLFHLRDVHGLRMSQCRSKCQQQKRNSEPLIGWTPDTASQKRKRQDGDERKSRPSQRSKGPVGISQGNEPTPHQSLERQAPDGIHQTISPHMLSEVSFTDISADDTSQDLPELTHSESTSPPDADGFHSMDDIILSGNFQPIEVHDKPEWLRAFPETNFDGSKTLSPDDSALFSMYLRSRSSSPSYLATRSTGNNNINSSIHSHTVTLSNICLSTVQDVELADSNNHNNVQPKNDPIETKKPRITLRMRQPEPRPKPKVLLRLSQPKQALSQKSTG